MSISSVSSHAEQSPGPATERPVLEIRDLHVRFRTPRGPVHAVDSVSLSLARGSTLGIVGESGSGKSALARAIMGLYATDGSVERRGQILLDGRDIAALGERDMQRIRGKHIGMVFQDPMSSLNPVMKIGKQITEVVQRHLGLDATAARRRALELVVSVGLTAPERRLEQYPMQLSGGMRQRVAIAIALAGGPKLLIADEPTTALDVTIQAQILELLWRIQEEHRMSVLLITHNLAVVASHCDEVLVMYAGKVVERAPTAQIIAQPLMPYTQALIRSVPSLSNPPHTRLSAIPGLPPSGLQLGAGCRFRERCVHARERCALEQPPLLGQGAHAYACWFPPTAGAPQ